MILNLLRKMFGSQNNRELKRLGKIVRTIAALEEEISQLSDQQLLDKTSEYRQRLEEGETLDQILPESFAVVREAGIRTMGMRHFDVQMLGGMTLNKGRITEMRTGEGKTLMATLPIYLNALTGKGVHLVTVNDYLANRDANWMRPLYEFLGLSVGVILSNQDLQAKKEAYACDITYGTNNEFGFDYLRDNMAFSAEDRVQRGLNFAIVDEVDSILIDEARTPLIISGAVEDSSKLYKRINTFVPKLSKAEMIEVEGEEVPGEGHYTVDEKQRQIELTEDGHQFIEELLLAEKLLDEGDSLYSASNLKLLQHVHSALRAHVLFAKNVEYIVQNGEVVLIDEHTGRSMPGRRLSEGLHQAIEAKENVRIQNESQTLASTTFQNYFRNYQKLSGMTGTADTEAAEFHQIYKLLVMVIPTNKPMVRDDLNDLVYLSKAEKFEAIVADVKECQAKNAPVLVGTASIETSEELSAFLKGAKIEHKVLNAKHHQQEAQIIAQAGMPGAVTIATNMAGRGTDIQLGGNLEVEIAASKDQGEAKIAEITADVKARHQQVLESGGLHILGTERHESRRIDNQLRGRSGRQGDPGVTRFYLSLEDNLMRIFASDRVKKIMQALGMERGEAIEHKMVSNAIEKAQRKVEGRNFDIRKQLLEYDDVANDQRQVVYQQRNELMGAEDITDMLDAIREDVVNQIISQSIPVQSIEEQWDIAELEKNLAAELGLELPMQEWLDNDDSLNEGDLREKVVAAATAAYRTKVDTIGPDIHRFEKHITLQVLDNLWKEHLATMDHLRQGIHLRGYAGKNPKQEYKRESFELFQELLENLKYEVVKFLAKVEIRREEEIDEVEQQRREAEEKLKQSQSFNHDEASALSEPDLTDSSGQGGDQAKPSEKAQPFMREGKKVGRNEPCPCGSGKKYKQCHGKL